MGWVKVGERSFSVSVKGVARTGGFSVSVNPTTVQAGGKVTVTVTVSNPNPFATQFAINVSLFGKRQSKTISVGPGGTGTATFTFTAPSQPGTYTGGVYVSMYVPDDYLPPG